ncbi:SDR family oxidoreductase [Ruegeria sp. 2205SS24-7]|uniref:SDR family oxidoreductase n=1 Tax=Ruegeria discodermiae TaxID=3064389 RepID=UPI0027421A33|nr:SDR family oxidoreductase [Ruegeria sp. 2205SS24-7]MDP5217290.1 SDR family oxidoreductase [Ruegeria sp. 2205SS24-7]
MAPDTPSDTAVAVPGISGKRVLVTGASSGLGVHFARLFAEHGAHVTAAERWVGNVEDLCTEIVASGGQAQALQLNVPDPASVQTGLEAQGFEIVINNAGTKVSTSALDHTQGDIDNIIDTSLKGVFHVAQTAARQMKDADQRGSIVNAASKGDVLQLTRALALEWARYGIRVNVLCLSYIETELNHVFFDSEPGKALIRRVPQRRLAQPQDLDGAILLLASDLGRYMIGADIAVDSGHLVLSL